MTTKGCKDETAPHSVTATLLAWCALKSLAVRALGELGPSTGNAAVENLRLLYIDAIEAIEGKVGA